MVWEVEVGEDAVAMLSTREDYDLVRRYNWHLTYNGYARANIGGRTVFMHRLIMNPGPGMVVDHINGNKLDNRRENLRICTPAENARNCGSFRNSTSRYKGVHLCSRSGKWRAKIHVNKMHFKIGYFATEEEAARAYDARARELHGEFARLNFGAV